ncbi:MAG TPA: transcriptional regulator, partial [Anaerolineae bacterium]|nr:transcriptional regulator [Anaerolineae bacterium]
MQGTVPTLGGEKTMLDDSRPVYTIGTAAELLEVHPRTLR